MRYDQLLAMKIEVQLALYKAFKDNEVGENKEKKIRNLIIRDAQIDARLHLAKYAVKPVVSKEASDAYKKAFKHEFLTQIKDGYSMESILESIDELIPNPGLNQRNYVKALKDRGYFLYKEEEDKPKQLVLTLKAERYLENEANKSLKEK